MANIKEIYRFYDIPPLTLDACNLLLGDYINSGSSRDVYKNRLNNKQVIKVAKSSYANILEHSVWEIVKDTTYAKWFCPVIDMSREGYFIIMPYCKPLSESDILPKLPKFFMDIKKANWGWYKGNIVCFDYQYIDKGIIQSLKN